MNKWIGIGRLTADPVTNTTPNGVSVSRFTLAIDRRYKDKDGNRQADFLPCIAYRAQADFVSKYFHKGDPCVVVGTVQTRSYEVEGQKRYVTEIITDEVSFVPSSSEPKEKKQTTIDDLVPIEDDGNSDLPF